MKLKYLYIVYRILGLILFLWSISVIGIYLITAYKIGHYPTFKNPHPRDLNFQYLNWFVIRFTDSFVFVWNCSRLFVLILILHMIFSIIKRIKPNILSILISSVGLIIFLLLWFLPGLDNIFIWYMN